MKNNNLLAMVSLSNRLSDTLCWHGFGNNERVKTRRKMIPISFDVTLVRYQTCSLYICQSLSVTKEYHYRHHEELSLLKDSKKPKKLKIEEL